jgi:hypothetical protein
MVILIFAGCFRLKNSGFAFMHSLDVPDIANILSICTALHFVFCCSDPFDQSIMTGVLLIRFVAV